MNISERRPLRKARIPISPVTGAHVTSAETAARCTTESVGERRRPESKGRVSLLGQGTSKAEAATINPAVPRESPPTK
jgi:hypothetical protein